MVEPIVKAKRGVPETVTVSAILRVNESEFPDKYVALDGPVTDEIVGAVRSIVTGVEVTIFAAGPLVLVTVP